MPVPAIVVSGKAGKPVDARRSRAIERESNTYHQHVREAVRARSLDRREGLVWDAYAGCDRAPFGWEGRA